MDSKRFDDLSRILSKRASRRGAFGALAGLTGMVGVGSIEAKSKRRGRKKDHINRVSADALSLSCPRLCALIFPFSRQRQTICVRNCECIQRCINVTDPAQQVACFRGIVTDPSTCTTPAPA